MMLALAALAAFVFARDRGPGPAEVALAYEGAWDHLDFTSLWTLSGDELRDGLTRGEFVAVKREAYARQHGLERLARDVVIEGEDSDPGSAAATVHTRVELRDGGTAHNDVVLLQRAGRWVVVGYQLRGES